MDLLLTLKKNPGTSLYQELANALEAAILEQKLKPGSPLPSIRDLANQYHLSVSTTIRAYGELASRRLIITAPNSGTLVSDQFDCESRSEPSPQTTVGFSREPRLSLFGQRLMASAQFPMCGSSLPAAEAIATATWKRILTKYESSYSRERALHDYALDPFEHAPLREAIANYLKRSHGIRCTFEQVLLTTSPRLDLLCRLLINPRDDVAMENPCFPAARRVIFSHGANVNSIDADSDGLNPAELFTSSKKYGLLYLCPSHLDPRGAVLTLERRISILDWSQRTDTIIFENDIDRNYFYTDRPLPALYSLVESDTVVCSGSFSLTIGPLASIGFLVLPTRHISPTRSLVSTVHPEPPVPENYALAEVRVDGHLERHIRKQRTSYKRQRQAVIFALTRSLQRLVKFKGGSGLHRLLRFDRRLRQQSILECASLAAPELISTQGYYLGNATNEFILPFSNLVEESISRVISRFASLLIADLNNEVLE